MLIILVWNPHKYAGAHVALGFPRKLRGARELPQQGSKNNIRKSFTSDAVAVLLRVAFCPLRNYYRHGYQGSIGPGSSGETVGRLFGRSWTHVLSLCSGSTAGERCTINRTQNRP